MLLGARQFFEHRGGAQLPYDAKVEYIESTGTQWIDTGLVATYNNSFGAEIAFTPTDVTHGGTGTTNTVCICGANSSANSGFELRWQYFSSSAALTLGGSYGSSAGGSVTANDIVNRSVVARNINGVITYDVDGARIIDRTATISNSGFVQGSVILFGVRRGSTVQWATLLWAKMKHAKFYLGNVLIQDLIPVRFTNELGQSEGAMYDLANPTVGMNRDGTPRDDGLYLNRGTGTFIYGNDK